MHSRTARARRAAAALACAGCLLPACGSAPDRALQRERAQVVFGPGETSATPSNATVLPVLTEKSSVHDYVRYGLLRNPSIRAAFDTWQAGLERVPQVGELPDPRFGYAYFIEEIQTRTGPQRNRFSVSQTIPWFGKLGQREVVAAAHAESLWWRVEVQRRQVARDVERAFYDYAYLARDVRIVADLLELLRGLEPVVQSRIETGASQKELLQLQVEIGKLEDNLATLESYRPALSAQLSAVLNRRQWDVLPFPELREPELVSVPLNTADQQLQDGNPELKELAERIRREQANRELAGLEGWPDLTLGVEYFETGDALIPGTPGSGDDPWSLSVSMNLPIYRGRYNALVREAEAAQSAARESLADRSNVLRGELHMALYRLDDAGRKVRLFRDTLLPRARKSLRVTETAYRSGNASLLELIDQQRALLAFEESYWRACADHGQALADLEALTGGLV